MTTEVLAIPDAPHVTSVTPATVYDSARASLLLARMERIPFSRWHTRARVVMGSATFLDAFDAPARLRPRHSTIHRPHPFRQTGLLPV